MLQHSACKWYSNDSVIVRKVSVSVSVRKNVILQEFTGLQLVSGALTIISLFGARLGPAIAGQSSRRGTVNGNLQPERTRP